MHTVCSLCLYTTKYLEEYAKYEKMIQIKIAAYAGISMTLKRFWKVLWTLGLDF